MCSLSAEVFVTILPLRSGTVCVQGNFTQEKRSCKHCALVREGGLMMKRSSLKADLKAAARTPRSSDMGRNQVRKASHS